MFITPLQFKWTFELPTDFFYTPELAYIRGTHTDVLIYSSLYQIFESWFADNTKRVYFVTPCSIIWLAREPVFYAVHTGVTQSGPGETRRNNLSHFPFYAWRYNRLTWIYGNLAYKSTANVRQNRDNISFISIPYLRCNICSTAEITITTSTSDEQVLKLD